ncbi:MULTISPECIES: glycosyltransferase family 2 protein [Bacillus]|uniref:glycosyltransferase family 2 protein n=1 Tax=Bacillus TaxID=1386 RepID=UPI0002DE016C|nr:MULTISPECIES: glycosyltransferase [Bacillus]
MDELISVIVPIYNVEKYLKRCVDSILNQTYGNIEVILVDDGSIDQSSKICDEYAELDQRIRVIHQKNQGLSAARNCGIDFAKGNFIAFVDSDDSIHEQMYEILHRNIKKYNADISICNYNRGYKNFNNENNINKMKESIIVCNKIESMMNMNNSLGEITIVAWNKLYRKGLFENIRFKVGKIHEDEFIIHRLLEKVTSVVYTSLPLYNYMQRDSSITRKKFNIKRLDVFEALEDRMDFFLEKGYKDLYFNAIESYLNTLITYYYYAKKDLNNELHILLRKQFNSLYASVVRNKNIKLTNKTRIKCKLFYISPLLYRMILRLIKKSIRVKNILCI